MSDDEYWSDENLVEDVEEVEELDEDNLKITKIKDLEPGMDNVHVKGVIDFIGDTQGKDYGEEPYAIGFIKDDSGEIKLTFWGDDVKKAKKGQKIMIIDGYVSEFREQKQLNPNRQRGAKFL